MLDIIIPAALILFAWIGYEMKNAPLDPEEVEREEFVSSCAYINEFGEMIFMKQKAA